MVFQVCVANVRLDLERFPNIPQWLKNIYTIKALFSITPEQMAETYVRAAVGEDVKNLTGKHIGHKFKEAEIPVYANDPLCIEQVMQLTYKQLGIQPAITYEQAE